MNTNLPPLLQASSGAVGSAVANAIVYPLDLATTRLQLAPRHSNTQKLSIIQLLTRLVKRKGWAKIYSGLTADTLNTVVSSFLYFLFYSLLHKALLRYRVGNAQAGASPAGIGAMSTKASEMRRPAPQVLSATQELFIGVAAGVASKGITLPISTVCVRQQLGNDDDDDEDHAPNGRMPPPQLSIIETIRAIHEESGVAGLFAGLPQTVPLALLPAMTMYIHALLLRSLPVRMRANPPGAATLVFGALSNALTALVLYPLVFAKALSQAGADKGKSKYSGGMIGMMRYIAQRDGWSGLYRGFQAYRIKGAVQQGVTMLIKQRVEGIVIRAWNSRS